MINTPNLFLIDVILLAINLALFRHLGVMARREVEE